MSSKASLDGHMILMLIETAYMALENEEPESEVWKAADEWLRAQDAFLAAIQRRQSSRPKIHLPGE
jgi:hypothetical protein